MRHLACLTLKDLTELAGIATATNGKVKAKGRRSPVLLDMVKAKETGETESTDASEGKRKNTRDRHRHTWRSEEEKEEPLIQAKFGAGSSQAH